MGFKNKKNWVAYKRQGEIVEIIIRDGGGQKIGDFKCINQKDYSRVINIIKEKFGYSPDFNIEEEKEKEISKEKGWLDKDLEW